MASKALSESEKTVERLIELQEEYRARVAGSTEGSLALEEGKGSRMAAEMNRNQEWFLVMFEKS